MTVRLRFLREEDPRDPSPSGPTSATPTPNTPTATVNNVEAAPVAASSPGPGSAGAGSTPVSTLSAAAAVPSVYASSGADAVTVMSANALGNWGSVFGDGAGLVTIVGQTTSASNGWHIVPSAANEYGPGLGAHEFKIDLAGEFQSDWYFV